MIETPTVDIISYMTNQTADTAGAGKSGAENPGDFEKVFSNVSKAYSKDDNQTNDVSKNNNNDNDNNNNNKIQKSSKDNEQATVKENDNNKDETVSSNKVEEKPKDEVQEKTSSENAESENTVKNQDNNEHNTKEVKDEKVDKNTQSKVQEPENNKVENSVQNESAKNAENVLTEVVNQVTEKIENASTEKIVPENKKNVKNDTRDTKIKTDSDEVNDSDNSKNNKAKDVSLQTKVDVTVAQVNDNLTNLLAQTQPQTLTNTAQNTKTTKESVKNIVPEQVQVAALNADNNTQTLAANAKTQVQAGQQINNNQQGDDQKQVQNSTQSVQVKNQQNTVVLTNNVQNNASDTTQTAKAQQNVDLAKATSADIQINQENLVVQDVNISPDETKTKQNSNSISDKHVLTQDILTKTNAKITNVETSNLSNFDANNSQTKQDTQDQIVKLALESNNKSNAPAPEQSVTPTAATATNTVTATADITDVSANSVLQNNFAKTLDSAQSQVQTATQTNTTTHTAKELSDNEILSQINSKLSNLKDEGTTKISMVLKPENLGKINLELVNSKEGLTAQITTNNQQVKEMLDKTIDTLKDNLSNQGVNVNNVTVKVEETQKNPANNMFSFENQSEQNNQQQSDNAKHTNQGRKTFGEETDNIISANFDADEEPASESITEKVISLTSSSGKVDYKV